MSELAVKSTQSKERAKPRNSDSGTTIDAPQSSTFDNDNILLRKASCACGGGCPTCQAKSNLNISHPSDPAELEADAIADRVMRMPDPGSGAREAQISSSGTHPRTVHRKCSSCETDEDKIIHRKPLASSRTVASPSPTHVQNAISSGGQPLDRSTRSFFEPRLGYDLSSVRIHTNSQAAESAKAIDAKAYTLGSDIVFAAGHYQLNSETSKHLLAHELAHVTQQAGRPQAVQRKANDEAPEIKLLDRREVLKILGTDLDLALDESTAATNIIGTTLEMPFTEKNARYRLQRLIAAISVLDEKDAAMVHRALTSPGNDKQKHLKERFGKLDSRFRSALLGLLQEKAKEKPGIAVNTQQPKYQEGKATWVELQTNVWGYVPEKGMTLKDVASYVSGNPKLYEGLVKLNDGIPKDAPIPVGMTVIIPVELIDQERAIGEMSLETRKKIWSLIQGKNLNQQTERLMRVKPGPLGPGMYGLFPVTTMALSNVAEAVQALWELIKKAEYAIAFAAGVVHGIFASLWDTISGIAKMVYDLIKSILTGELIDDIKKFVNDVKGITLDKVKEMLGEWADKWAEKLNSKSAWTAGHAHGYLTGYVMAEVAMLLLTGGAATEAKAAFWATRVGKTIRASSAFIAAEEKLAKAAEAGGKIAQAIEKAKEGKAGLVVKGAVKVVEIAGWTAEKIGKVLSLPGDIAVWVIDKALQNAKRLGPFFERIGKLAERVKKFIFGCMSPCNWDAATVENLLKHLKDDKQLEILCDSANRAKLMNEKWFEKTLKVGDALPEGYQWRDGKIARNAGKRKANYAPLEYDKNAKKIQVRMSNERISNPTEMNKNYKKAVEARIREENKAKPLSDKEFKKRVDKEVGDNAVHHLIPDNLVQDHPFGDAARKAGYDLDRGTNLQGLKKTEKLTDVDAGDVGHWSSHPKYDKLVDAELTKAQKAIEKDFGSLDNALKTPAGKQRMIDEMKKIEDKFRKMFETGDKTLPIDPRTGRITEFVPEKSDEELETAYV